MFCATLRTKPRLRKLLRVLTASKDPKFREIALNTHDISLPLLQYQESHGTGTHESAKVRFLVFMAADLQAAQAQSTQTRLARLASLTGGANIAIIFIDDPMAQESFADLQLLIHNNASLPYLPILPVNSTDDLLAILKAYVETLQKSTAQPTPSRHPALSSPVPLTLLSQASPDAPTIPIPEHEVLILSDVLSGFRELLLVIATGDGRRQMEDLVGAAIVDRLASFWTEEYVVE